MISKIVLMQSNIVFDTEKISHFEISKFKFMHVYFYTQLYIL